ncbi:hypothetical protein [Sphingobacterium puteale]|uniref:hypothetical protein n=1 Tax=Sphingobacterium puteale TaxID=2420510 RepID=UPI0011C3F5BB|nr:hypothetical protein [Sphingobacterium puteale]
MNCYKVGTSPVSDKILKDCGLINSHRPSFGGLYLCSDFISEWFQQRFFFGLFAFLEQAAAPGTISRKQR